MASVHRYAVILRYCKPNSRNYTSPAIHIAKVSVILVVTSADICPDSSALVHKCQHWCQSVLH